MGPRVWTWTLALLFFLACGLPARAGSSLESLVQAVKEQSKHVRSHLPSVDLSVFDLENLLQRAESREGSQDKLVKELTKVAMELNRQAKVAVLNRLRQEFESSKSSPTDEESYRSRRQLILTFDFLERSAGRRPIYPRELGRPFVVLVETPSRMDMKVCDGFLEFLSKIPLPPTPGGIRSGGGAGGSNGGGGGEGETGEPSSGGGGGYLPSSGDFRPSSSGPIRPDHDEEPLNQNRGWEIVRWYIFGTLAALFSLYLIYLAYTAFRGGSSMLSYFRQMLRTRYHEIGEPEDPFRKGLSLFGQSKYPEAIKILEPLTERALQSTQPAHYYVVLAALKTGKVGLVRKHVPLLLREKFAPDELYRLAVALEDNGSFNKMSLELFLYLAGKDSTFRDVQKRAEKLEAKISIPS